MLWVFFLCDGLEDIASVHLIGVCLLVIADWLLFPFFSRTDKFKHALVCSKQSVEVAGVEVDQLFHILIIHKRIVRIALP